MADQKKQNGLSADRLRHLKAVIEDDVKRGRYYGGVILVARDGVVGLHEAIGFTNAKDKKPVTKKSVFSLSTTKAITNVLVFRAIERGEFALTTKVSEIIPEFSGGQREHITFFHLLTHSSGLPSVFTPKAGMCIDRLYEIIAAICENVHCTDEPGKVINYAPMAGHALMGEAVRRTDPKKRSYRQLVEDEILKPLKMKDTSIGVRKDLKARHIVPIFLEPFPFDHLGHSNLGKNGAFEEEKAEMPWVGGITTVADLFRFAEMLRRGGELDGARIFRRRFSISRTGIGQATNRMNFQADDGGARVGRLSCVFGAGFSGARRRDLPQFVWNANSSEHLGIMARGVPFFGSIRNCR